MSWEGSMWAAKHGLPKCENPGQIAMLMAVAGHTGKNLRSCFASLETLAAEAKMSGRSAMRRIDELAALGLIKPGDPSAVAHLRADRRPQVWDLAGAGQVVTSLENRRSATRQFVTPQADGTPDDPPRGDNLSFTGCQIGVQTFQEKNLASTEEPPPTPTRPTAPHAESEPGDEGEEGDVISDQKIEQNHDALAVYNRLPFDDDEEPASYQREKLLNYFTAALADGRTVDGLVAEACADLEGVDSRIAVWLWRFNPNQPKQDRRAARSHAGRRGAGLGPRRPVRDARAGQSRSGPEPDYSTSWSDDSTADRDTAKYVGTTPNGWRFATGNGDFDIVNI